MIDWATVAVFVLIDLGINAALIPPAIWWGDRHISKKYLRLKPATKIGQDMSAFEEE